MDYKIILNKTKQMPRRRGNASLGIRMNADLINELKAACKEEDIFLSELIEMFLIEFLSSYKKTNKQIAASIIERKKWP